MDDVQLEGEVLQLVSRKWKKRYMSVKKNTLLLYEKEDVNSTPLLRIPFREIKVITEATFIGDQTIPGKKDVHNCGFKVDYGVHSLSFQANGSEDRDRWVQGLQDFKIDWQNQSTPTPTETKVFFDQSSNSIELVDSGSQKDPLGLVVKENVSMREGYEGKCSVKLLYSDGSTHTTTLSTNMTGEEVLSQVQDSAGSSSSSLFLLDTKGVVQRLKLESRPGPILARLYGVCVVEPQNRVFVVHFPNGDWVPLILSKSTNCQQILQSEKIIKNINEYQITKAALFLRTQAELQPMSTQGSGEVQLPPLECPADILYRQSFGEVEPNPTLLIVRPGTGSTSSWSEKSRAMTLKDKYTLLSSPTSKVKNQKKIELIYDEAIGNLENDPLQSSIIVPRFTEERPIEMPDSSPAANIPLTNYVIEESALETSVELLPASEPRARLPPLHSTSPGKSDGVMKRLQKTLHGKKASLENRKSLEDILEPVQTEGRRVRSTALSTTSDQYDEHMYYVEEASKRNTIFEMSVEETSEGIKAPHHLPPGVEQELASREFERSQNVRPSSLAPILSAREIARHVTSAKTPDEEINPLIPKLISKQEIAKYPKLETLENSSSLLKHDDMMADKKKTLDKNAIMSEIASRANMTYESNPPTEQSKIVLPPIIIPGGKRDTQPFEITSPAVLRTWVINSTNPPNKIKINKSVLERKNNKWVLASDSQYSDVFVTSSIDEYKSIFKLPGDIGLVYYEKNRQWSVTGPKFIKSKVINQKQKIIQESAPVRVKERFTQQAVAQFPNVSTREDELGFEKGAVMFVVAEFNEEWLKCEDQSGKRGFVPRNYVEIIDLKAPTPPPLPTEEVDTKDQTPPQEPRENGEKEEKPAEVSSKEEIESPQSPPPILDIPTQLATLLRQKIKKLQNSVDPILWHSGATRDPEAKKQLFDDKKTPAIAVLIRGRLCSAVAEILITGLKSRSSFFQIESNSVWSIVKETLKFADTIPACKAAFKAVEDIEILSEVTNTPFSTSAKYRSFICQALNNHFLELWLHAVFFDLGGIEGLNNLYEIESFVVYSRHPKIQPLLKEMLLTLQPLDALEYKLTIDFERGRGPPEETSMGAFGKKFGSWFVKTMTSPITPLIGAKPSINSTTPISSKATSRENLSEIMYASEHSSSDKEHRKVFVLPGETVHKESVTVDTANEVAVADGTFRKFGTGKTIEQLNKIVEGDSNKQEDPSEDVDK